MKEERLDIYAKLNDGDGFKTYFRKFDEGTWIFQFDEKGEYVGGVRILSETLKAINNAPSVKAGDGKTKQTLF